MILCTSLVMLMTPGLAFFYGGLVGRKNVLAIMIQSFVSMGWTTVIWYLYGYSLCFSGDWHGIIGNLHNACLHGINLTTAIGPNNTIPAMVFIAYQMMFAIITPALISGAFTNRVTFKAYCLFLTGMADLRLLPLRAHGLGRRNPAALGRGGLRRRHRGAQHRRTGRPGFGSLCRQAADTGSRPAQHSAGRPGHRTVVVRLVRLQRRQRNAGGFGDGDRLPEHRYRRVVRRRGLAGCGVVPRAKAQVPRPAHRRGRRTGDHHSCRRLCFAHHGRHHRGGLRRGLLLRGRDEEQTALGRRARCLGRARSRWLPRHPDAGTVRQQSLQSCRDQRLALRQSRLLLEAGGRGALLVGMGVRFHLRHAVRHQPVHSGQSDRDERGDRPG